MSIIVRKGVIRDGQVIVDQPINLPDGSEVTITGMPHGEFSGEEDNDRPLTPEEIAATLAAMDKIEPFEMTPEAEAALATERQARKDWEKAHFAEQAEKLRRMWE
ncbi:MAG TPA: hypothetical protein VG122_01925 [Gemmata sp.]|jgi:hypothetical protein|nr:hypothetical protein [Gemmata sp.]